MQPSHICHVNYTLNWMHLDYPQFVFSLSEGLDNQSLLYQSLGRTSR